MAAFFAPWLNYKTDSLGSQLFSAEFFGLPNGKMVVGWEIPNFMATVEESWVLRFRELLVGESHHATYSYFVYLSPICGLITLYCLWTRRRWGIHLLMFAHLAMSGYILLVVFRGIPDLQEIGIQAKFAWGLVLALACHFATFWIFATSGRQLMRT